MFRQAENLKFKTYNTIIRRFSIHYALMCDSNSSNESTYARRPHKGAHYRQAIWIHYIPDPGIYIFYLMRSNWWTIFKCSNLIYTIYEFFSRFRCGAKSNRKSPNANKALSGWDNINIFDWSSGRKWEKTSWSRYERISLTYCRLNLIYLLTYLIRNGQSKGKYKRSWESKILDRMLFCIQILDSHKIVLGMACDEEF